jgi:hypothetical protein
MPPSARAQVQADEQALDREHLMHEDAEQDFDNEDDIHPLLPESDLFIERLRNELDGELAGVDSYERSSS